MNLVSLFKKVGLAEPPPATGAHSSGLVELNAFPIKLPDPPAEPAVPTVHFQRSGVTFPWEDRYESLLEFADDHAIEISAGCKYGDCGTCLTPLLQGTVSYNHRTGITPDLGFCLPCSCHPSTSIILDI